MKQTNDFFVIVSTPYGFQILNHLGDDFSSYKM